MERIGTLIIGAVIAVVLFAALLVPVIDSSTATDRTFTNDGYFRMSHYGTDDEITMQWDATSPKTVVVNDVEVPIEYYVDGGQVTLIADTNFIARLNSTNSLSYIGSSGGTHTTTESATYVFSGGTATITNIVEGSPVVYTASYSDIYVPSNDGEFVMKKYDKSAYLNEDSVVFAYGMTRVKNAAGGSTSSPGFGLEFEGSIADGLTSRVWRGDGLTLSDEQINYSVDSRYLDLYTFDAITATGTFTEVVEDQTVLTDTLITYNYLLVPYQVTAEKAQHMSPAEISLVSIIPILVLAGVLVAIAYVVGSRAEIF